MRTDSPGPVISQIGTIEDALAVAQNAHADSKGHEFDLALQLKVLKAGFREEATGSNKEAREAWVDEQLAGTDTWEEWRATKEQLLKHEIRYEYLSKRLSACQSVLNTFKGDGSMARFGQGAPQRVAEPSG